MFGTQISKAEIPGFEDVLGHYVDAFNKLCEMTDYTREDLERIRLIFTAAWKYRELFREYEQLEDLEARVEKLEALLAEIKKQRTRTTS